MSKSKKKKSSGTLLSVKEAAAFCRVTTQWLYQCRANGGKSGPASSRMVVHGMGKGPSLRVVYLKSDLIAWNAARKALAKKQQSKKAA